MFPTGHLLAFSLTSFAVIVVPGPSVLFVVSRSVTLGRRAGLATVAGNASGFFIQVVAIALGIGAIVERSIAVFTIMKLAGAGYLIFLGVRALLYRRSLALSLDVIAEPKGTRRIVWDGLVVGVSNPKSIVLFAAVLPQFVDHPAGHVPLQLLLLGLVSIAIALVSDGMWAVAAGAARSWLARTPRRLELLGGVGGLVMIGLGVRLTFTGRSD